MSLTLEKRMFWLTASHKRWERNPSERLRAPRPSSLTMEDMGPELCLPNLGDCPGPDGHTPLTL